MEKHIDFIYNRPSETSKFLCKREKLAHSLHRAKTEEIANMKRYIRVSGIVEGRYWNEDMKYEVNVYVPVADDVIKVRRFDVEYGGFFAAFEPLTGDNVELRRGRGEWPEVYVNDKYIGDYMTEQGFLINYDKLYFDMYDWNRYVAEITGLNDICLDKIKAVGVDVIYFGDYY